MVCLIQYWGQIISLISSFLDYNCWGKSSCSFRDPQVTDFSIRMQLRSLNVPSLQSMQPWASPVLEFSCFPSLLSCSNQILLILHFASHSTTICFPPLLSSNLDTLYREWTLIFSGIFREIILSVMEHLPRARLTGALWMKQWIVWSPKIPCPVKQLTLLFNRLRNFEHLGSHNYEAA